MKVGILGAGQLSRMLALAGIPLGIEFAFYEPNPTNCVSNLGDVRHASFQDKQAFSEFVDGVDVLTYENENISLDVLDAIAAMGKTVYPGPQALAKMQDRLHEKSFLNDQGIPTATYYVIDSHEHLINLKTTLSFPAIVKKRTQGYDGRGQFVLRTVEDIDLLTDEQCQNAIVEEFVNFDREVSLVGCRDRKGNIVFYDLCENVHHDGILHYTYNKPNDPAQEKAKHYLTHVMESLGYVGVCTLEFFQKGDELIANELAPRVHNTGHWTIEGAQSSQFENHLRAILNWPLGDTTNTGEFVMYNIIGEFPDRLNLLKIPAMHIHDYQKAPREKRKIGHLTFPVNHEVMEQVASVLTIS